MKSSKMFCAQCSQHSIDCKQAIGDCRKTPDVANMQDVLVKEVKEMGYYLHHARQNGKQIPDHLNHFTLSGIFTTLTNVNNDPVRFKAYIAKAQKYLMEAKALAGDVPRPTATDASVLAQRAKAADANASSLCEMLIYGRAPSRPPKPRTRQSASSAFPSSSAFPGLAARDPRVSPAILSESPARRTGGPLRGNERGRRRRTRVAGIVAADAAAAAAARIKGVCAYADHAFMFGKEDPRIYAFIHEVKTNLLAKINCPRRPPPPPPRRPHAPRLPGLRAPRFCAAVCAVSLPVRRFFMRPRRRRPHGNPRARSRARRPSRSCAPRRGTTSARPSRCASDAGAPAAAATVNVRTLLM